MNDLQQFVVNAKKQNQQPLPPIPTPEAYRPFLYQSDGEKDPFFPDLSIKSDSQSTSSSRKDGHPNHNRKKEVLEKFPLDSLKMVGTISLEETNWVLIQTTDNTLYKAKTGQYIGENMGRITQITNTKIEIVETIPDGLGGWMKRYATMLLSK